MKVVSVKTQLCFFLAVKVVFAPNGLMDNQKVPSTSRDPRDPKPALRSLKLTLNLRADKGRQGG